MSTSTYVLGDDELLKELKALGDKTEDILEPAAQDGAQVVADRAEQGAPKRTEFLATHVDVEVSEKNRDEVIFDVGPEKEAFWGLFQEMGTPHHAAQPFLRPALDESTDQVIEAVARAARQALGL